MLYPIAIDIIYTCECCTHSSLRPVASRNLYSIYIYSFDFEGSTYESGFSPVAQWTIPLEFGFLVEGLLGTEQHRKDMKREQTGWKDKQTASMKQRKAWTPQCQADTRGQLKQPTEMVDLQCRWFSGWAQGGLKYSVAKWTKRANLKNNDHPSFTEGLKHPLQVWEKAARRSESDWETFPKQVWNHCHPPQFLLFVPLSSALACMQRL